MTGQDAPAGPDSTRQPDAYLRHVADHADRRRDRTPAETVLWRMLSDWWEVLPEQVQPWVSAAVEAYEAAAAAGDAPAGPVLGEAERRALVAAACGPRCEREFGTHTDLLRIEPVVAALLSSERRRIAQEIEALIGEESAPSGSPAAHRERGAYGAFRIAARIARRGGSS